MADGKDLIRFQFVVANEAQFSRKVYALAGAVKDMTPAWEEISADFYAGEKALFDKEGASDTSLGWHSLTPEYEAWKQKKGYSSRILVQRGDLMASLTNKDDSGAIYEMKPMSLVMGTKVRTDNGKFNLGMIAQVGTRYSPVREVIRLTDAQKKRWSKAMAGVVRKAMKEAL